MSEIYNCSPIQGGKSNQPITINIHRTRSRRIIGSLAPKPKAYSHCTRLATALICCYLITQTASTTARELNCYCNECDTDSCTTTDHRDSNCFKSVERLVENKTYVFAARYGCISGADGSLAVLQCRIDTSRHIEPRLMICCQNEDHCNVDLPDPDENEDPRWKEDKPPEPKPDPNEPIKLGSSIGVVIFLTAVILTWFAAKAFTIYILTPILKYRNSRNTIDSRDSVYSFKINFDEQLKNQFVNHHHNNASSSASTHTYTISDYLSPKPSSPHDFEHSIASIEHTSTLPDLTSGVGTRILEQRTMARVVDAGKTVPVGCGRFGRVFKGSYHGEDFAVKAFQPIDHESWQREEKIIRKLNHENIVRYYASETYTVAIHATETWMFLEFCPLGSLCDFLDQNEIRGPQQAINILYSIIKGLSYLHEDYSTGKKPPIAHRDIKSRNILMRTPEVCCLADFGHAVVKVNEESLDFGGYDRLQVGTIRYIAPEILKPSENLDTTQFHTFAQADLYQFGLVLWEVCNRTALDLVHQVQPHRLPYDGVVPQNPGIEDMIEIVCEPANYRPPMSPDWRRQPLMTELSFLMVECWRPNPKARMETLGVKKRLKGLYDQTLPQQAMYYQNNMTLSPDFNINRAKITEKTL